MKVDLNGKIAVVTGGGGVLCAEIAHALSKSGAKVAVLDLNADAAEKVAAAIRADGGIAIGVAANVLDLESLKAAESTVRAEFGICDILINGAGGNSPKGTTSKEYLEQSDLADVSPELKTFFDLDPAGISFVFNLNFIGTLLPTQVFAHGMAERGKGAVLNISSMNAFTPLTKIPAYSAAKAAVSNFTRWLSVHFAKVNIKVNAIAPGFFLTEQNRALLNNPDGTLTARGDAIIRRTPMGRFGKPSDLCGAVLFLLDEDASAFINGVVLPVDGAFSAFSGV
ncbi:MAG: SDR family oxidoreductase [Victivallales bacterium]|jgi:NAD(P)-dependent dehydrogenase (short-subunit alcohol dehydrogenase family)|nr:SDR family oxidoreductase [Victivallales bacterium]